MIAGATFKSVDLHVHTGASADVTDAYGDLDPGALVARALEVGLDAIAITDHNTVDACDDVRAAAQGTSLTVFPGVEISTPDGHLLAIFDPECPVAKIRDVLTIVGIDSDHYGRTDSIAQRSLAQVAEEVGEAGGIAIAAHITSSAGFWSKTDGTHRQGLHSNMAINAVEVTDLTMREVLEAGAIDGYERPITCIQASDSWAAGADCHSLSGVGSRRTWIKMAQPTRRALHHALKDPLLRVRLAGDDRSSAARFIRSATITGGFFDEQTFDLSPDVTSIIGGTGTGKSLIIELIRFALDQQTDATDFPSIRSEIDERLRNTLGAGSSVRLAICIDGDEFVVERAWHDNGPGDAVVFQLIDSVAHTVSGADPRTLFPIRAFSQSEVIEYARAPVARLSLIDGRTDLDEPRLAETECVTALSENARQLIELDAEIDAVKGRLEQLPETKRRVEALSEFFDADEVKVQGQWEAEGAYLRAASDYLAEIRHGVSEAAPLPVSPDPLEGTPNSPDLDTAARLLADATQFAEECRTELVDKLDQAMRELDTVSASWTAAHTAFEERIRALLAQVEDATGAGRASLLAQLQRLQAAQAELEREGSALDSDLLPRRAAVSEQREGLLRDLGNARAEIRRRRRAIADELNERMAGTVRITIDQWAQKAACFDALLSLRTGSNVNEGQLRALADTCHPLRLVKSILAGDFETPAGLAGLDASAIERLHDAIVERGRIADLYDFQALNIDDGVSIQFAIDDEAYRSIEALAHGQKCTAILIIAMAEGSDPLIIDQPEDALHAPWIETYLVETLRRSRGQRQCLFATRSPGIVVSANSEQVISLEATADRGNVQKSGALDEFETTELVVHHVEGGRAPLARRQAAYDV